MVVSLRNGVPLTEQETEAMQRLDRLAPDGQLELEEAQKAPLPRTEEGEVRES